MGLQFDYRALWCLHQPGLHTWRYVIKLRGGCPRQVYENVQDCEAAIPGFLCSPFLHIYVCMYVSYQLRSSHLKHFWCLHPKQMFVRILDSRPQRQHAQLPTSDIF